MPKIKRDHLRVDVGLIPLLQPNVPPRQWLDQVCASYFFADLHDCLLRLGVQSGVGEEVLQSRAKIKGGGPLGEATTDLVNQCVGLWVENVAKGLNPGIMPPDLAIPAEYAVPVLGRLRKFATYANGELGVELGLDSTTFSRAMKGTSLLQGGPYFKSVRLLAGLIGRLPSEIIGNRVLVALSRRPPEKVAFLRGAKAEAPIAEAEAYKVYSLDHVLKNSSSPEEVRASWESYASQRYGDRVMTVLEIRNQLKGKAKISEGDLEASLRSYHGLNGHGSSQTH